MSLISPLLVSSPVHAGRTHSVYLAAVKVANDDSEDERARLTYEGSILDMLDHPHIIPMIGLSDSALVTTWVEDTLHSRMGDHSKFAIPCVFIQLLDALAYLHDTMHIVHADIKPANITTNGRGKNIHSYIIDFGNSIMRNAAGLYDCQGSWPTTFVYAAPECLIGDEPPSDITPAADIWSLGIVLWELCIGFSPILKAIGSGPRSEAETRRRVLRKHETIIADVNETVLNPLYRKYIGYCLAEMPEARLRACDLRACFAMDTKKKKRRHPLLSPIPSKRRKLRVVPTGKLLRACFQ